MTLIPEASQAGKMLSMWLAAALAIYGLLPPDVQEELLVAILEAVHLPRERLPLALAVIAAVARLVRQRSISRGDA